MQQSTDFFTRLLSVQHRLPRKMAQLAAFISDNYVRVAFMTTREVAAAADVSLATVVRFPLLLGYADYDDFRNQIRARVNHDLRGITRLQTVPTTDGSVQTLIEEVVAAEIRAMHAMLHNFDAASFEQMVTQLVQARRVILIGFRSTAPLVTYTGATLRKMRPDVLFFSHADSHIYDEIHLCNPDDVLLFIGFAPYLAEFLTFARYAHQRELPLAAITDSPLSPLVALSRTVLMAHPGALDFAGSLATISTLLHALLLQIGRELGATAQERLQHLTDAAVAAGVYDRTGNRLPIRPDYLPEATAHAQS